MAQSRGGTAGKHTMNKHTAECFSMTKVPSRRKLAEVWVKLPCCSPSETLFQLVPSAGHGTGAIPFPGTKPRTRLSAMNAVVNAQLERMEIALQRLIDSVTPYNPSPSAALDLVAADDGLADALEELSTHQKNHARIRSLQTEIDALDTHIKDHLRGLAQLRGELRGIDVRQAAQDDYEGRELGCRELLDYATKISRFTVAPTQRPIFPEATPTVATEAHVPAVNGINGNATAMSRTQSTQDGTRAAWQLPDADKATLEIPRPFFVPWPDENRIRSGGLAQMHRLAEQGVDPVTVTRDEEVKEAQHSEEVLGARENGGRMQRRAGATSSTRQQAAAEAFEMALYDPDADEE